MIRKNLEPECCKACAKVFASQVHVNKPLNPKIGILYPKIAFAIPLQVYNARYRMRFSSLKSTESKVFFLRLEKLRLMMSVYLLNCEIEQKGTQTDQ